MRTKKPDDETDTPPPFEIGSPLEREEPIAQPGPPRRKLSDLEKTPRVEHTGGKRTGELYVALDRAEAEVARLRSAVEGDIDVFTEEASKLVHEGDEIDDVCSEGPEDCIRCALEGAAQRARAILNRPPPATL